MKRRCVRTMGRVYNWWAASAAPVLMASLESSARREVRNSIIHFKLELRKLSLAATIHHCISQATTYYTIVGCQ